MDECKAIAFLSDGELLARLDRLRRREHETLIEILHHLNEVERRKLHLKLGYASMFDYCVKHLRYSESAACRRISAARCINRFPMVERLLEHNELSLSSVDKIAKILNEHNAEQIVPKACGATALQVDALVADYRPPVQLRDRVRPVRVVVPQELGENHLRCGGKELAAPAPVSAADPCDERRVAEPRQAPCTESKLHVQFLASPEFMKKYEEACALLSNQLGKLSMEAVLTAILVEFIQRHSPQERQARREQRESARAKKLPAGKPAQRTCDTAPGPRQISVSTRDAVFVRDKGRCAFVGSTGKRCEETRNLHVDHVTPVARSGTSEPGNLRLLCARHNQLEADRILGSSLMDRYRHEQTHMNGP